MQHPDEPKSQSSTDNGDQPPDTAAKPRSESMTLVLHYRRVFIVFAHICVFAISLLLAFALFYNFRLTNDWFRRFYLPLLPIVLLIKLLVFWRHGLYHGWWRYVSLQDLFRITVATHISTFIFVVVFFTAEYIAPRLLISFPGLLPNDIQFPQVIFLLDWACTIALATGIRVAVRMYHEEFRQLPGGRVIRLLIVGAGDAGEMALREIHRMRVVQYEVIGLLDDDPTKHGASILGCKVLGGTQDIRQICEDKQIDEVVIAMPSAPPKAIREIVERCRGTNVRFRTLPAMADVLAGKVTVSQMRDVDINDLLGREPAKLDTAAISDYIQDKVVMITGAGGSIGSEMCRQVAGFAPTKIVLVEQAENALFSIEGELRQQFPELTISAYICDIYDKDRIEGIFRTERPAAVFHAAAHKHVPLMELNPSEAIKNNVFGTKNCADAAAKHGCQKFVMISTDKAVNPTSVMGCSKRVAEMYIQGISVPGGTQFVTVRFGNVLGSNGSVVPIFKDQIAKGGPITVTHPDMQRYFMTIPEASQLVMQAAAIGKGGEVFLLDMGDPVKIVDLARDLITLSGYSPGDDIEITFSGVRPGEKLFEELSIQGEDMAPTSHEKIAIWKRLPMQRDAVERGLEKLATLTNCRDGNTIREALRELVPEYQYNNHNASVDNAQAPANRL